MGLSVNWGKGRKGVTIRLTTLLIVGEGGKRNKEKGGGKSYCVFSTSLTESTSLKERGGKGKRTLEPLLNPSHAP